MLINFNHLKTFYNALVHKMKNFRGNWNQNDPTADDYIANRPFYEESKEVFIVSNLTSEEYANGQYPPCNFIPGEKYTVIWNGQRYENVVCCLESGYNALVLDGIFYINDDGGDGLYIDESEGFTVSICKREGIIRKLDEKFLPDSVVTSDNLKELLPDDVASETYVANQDVVVLAEAQKYTDQAEADAILAAKTETETQVKALADTVYTQEQADAAIELAVTSACSWGSF